MHSCLGMLVNDNGDFLDPATWTKVGPVFAPTPTVWGIGHCSLVNHEEGGVIFYHAKTRRRRGWRDRNIRAQRFTWGPADMPCFGDPAAPRQTLLAGGPAAGQQTSEHPPG